MKAILSKKVVIIVLVIAGLAAGTGLVAGYIDRPSQAPQATVEAQAAGCPHMAAGTCPKMAGASADPQVQATAAACPGMASMAGPCAAMPVAEGPCGSTAASTAPCTGTEDCPMPCCQKTGQAPASGCTMAQPQAAPSTEQAVSPCGSSGCTHEE